ncbi:MAG: bifunctional folylpolyglutamate synthase/dihydrofolate synthase [Hydrogenibacillus sp.]|nr:bifunctional folylpolyglutamate synthase/dihydrofolate synthase [Hydrogenibacillus sp.]
MSTKTEIIAWFEGHRRDVYEPGTVRMEALLERLDHPERRLKFVHIAGTNGKGSTLAFLQSILRAAGYDVGAYISPHVTTYESRIQLNGEPIDEAGLAFVYETLRPHAEALAATPLGAPTEFELLTAAAIVYFAKRAYPDIVLFETGLGGRLDSTNVVYPLVSVITSIGFDHIRLLGSTLAAIAREKAGIIKSGVPVVTTRQDAEAMRVIRDTAKAKRADLYALDERFWVEDPRIGPSGQSLSVRTPHRLYPGLRLGMRGVHQFENAALAVMAAELLRLYYAFDIEDEHVREGLLRAENPGRMELFEGPGGVNIVLDGAHNESGMRQFAASLEALCPAARRVAVFAAMKDKDHRAMLSHLLPHIEALVVTTVDLPRAENPAVLSEEARMIRPELPIYIQQAPPQALEAALRIASKAANRIADESAPNTASSGKADGAVLRTEAEAGAEGTRAMVAVTGSLYLIQAVRPTVIEAFPALGAGAATGAHSDR